MRFRQSLRQRVAAVKEAVSRSGSRERNGDQSDVEVIDGQAKADVKPSSSNTPDATLQNIDNANRIPDITVTSPESSSRDRRDYVDIKAKASDSEPSTEATPTEALPQESDVAEQSPENAEPPTEPLRWDNLWQEAYEGLHADDEYADLLAKFEEHLLESGDGATDGKDAKERSSGDRGPEKLKEIQALAQHKLDKLPEARLSFTVGSTKVVVRETVRKTAHVISTFKDIINPVVSSEPCSAVAWGGIMAILPLVENALQQDDNAASGLEDIAFLLVRYRRLQEEILAPASRSNLSTAAREVFSNVRSKLVDIYTKVFVYEISFVLQYGRSRAHRTARDVVIADGWKDMWASIESASQDMNQAVQEHVSARSLKALDEIAKRTENIEALQRETLETVEDGNRTNLIMSLNSAPNAIFDSGVIVGAEAACLEGTQSEILNTIQDWAENPDGEIIFWLHGMAGTGKTSVALAVANALNDRRPFTDGRKPARATFLGASFFFKQGDRTRNTTERLFTTLARSLAQEFADLKVHIADAVAKNLDIGSKAPQQQLNGLIIRPVSVVDGETFLPVRLVVVVDALDECIDHTEVDNLIGMLRALEKLHQVKIRVLITSRRDNHIDTSLNNLPTTTYRRSLLPKVPLSDNEDEVDDITFYLLHTLGDIATRRGVPKNKIERDDIARLSQKADGLFIYAATLCRFLDTEDFTDNEARRERLGQIFDDGIGEEAPQQKVDEIYMKVLAFPQISNSTAGFKKRFYDNVANILGFITVLFEPASIASLSALLPLDAEKLESVLRKLYSVLDVREDRNAPLALVHLSFRDFLLDQGRCSSLPFQIQEVAMHRAVFERCLQIMSESLSQDMCGLVLPGSSVATVSRDQLERGIPRHVQYACRYWVDHLQHLEGDQRGEVGLVDDGAVQAFFRKRLLFWLEAMSLIREAPAVVHILNNLDKMVNGAESPELSALIFDSKRFVLANRWVLDNAPMQLYPALIFSPSKSLVRCNFEHLIPSWVILQPRVSEDWDPNYSVLEMPPRSNRFELDTPFAFSPVGHLIVCAFRGHTMIWDHVTGTELYTFDDKRDVLSVTFSPDGRRVASAIGDTIRVRDYSKGTSVDLIYKKQFFFRVGFLPGTSNLLVSVSHRTVCTWNIDEERAVRISNLSEYTNMNSGNTVLSPLSDFAVASSTRYIMVSSFATEQDWKELRHKYFVSAIAVSPDGNTVLSADSDPVTHTGRFIVWDVKTGDIRHEFPYEHTIRHIASTEQRGGLLAIATGDSTIQLRQLETWHLAGCLDIDGRLKELSFSPDGNLLAASVDNGKLRLWDLTAKAERTATNRPHRGCLSSVINVPGDDGKAFSIGEGEGALWDSSGALMQTTSEDVWDVVISPDGGIIGMTGDNGVQLWNNCMTKTLLVSDTAQCIEFSPGGDRIFLGAEPESNVRTASKILNASTLEEMALMGVPPQAWENIFSPNGRLLCWFGYNPGLDDFLCLLDLENSKLLQSPIRTHRARDILRTTSGYFVKPDVQFVETDDIVKVLLETGTGNEPAVLAIREMHGFTFFLASYPAGNVFATSPNGIDLEVKERASRKWIRTLKIDGAYKIEAIAISRTGKLAVAAQMTGHGLIHFGAQPFGIHLWDFSSGAEIGKCCIKVLPYRDMLKDMSFSSDARYLEAKVGRLPVPRAATHQGTGPEEDLSEIPVSSLYQEENWLVQEFEKLLWLPPAYREVWPAFDGPRVVFGRQKGMVVILKLDLEKTPIADQARERRRRHNIS